MKKKLLNVGMIGVGEQGWDNILPSIAKIPILHLVAVCDIEDERTNIGARQYGARSYRDIEEMFNREDLDLVIVATSPQIHEYVIEKSIEFGIHVFVEKPPTVKTDKLLQLVENLKDTDIKTGVGLNFSFAETLSIINNLPRSEIGNIISVV